MARTRKVSARISDKLRRVGDSIEFFSGNDTALHSGFAQGEVLLGSVMGNGRCLVVANGRAEGRDEHKRLAYVFSYALMVERDALNAEFAERTAGICEESCGMKHVEDDNGPHGVQFEVAL